MKIPLSLPVAVCLLAFVGPAPAENPPLPPPPPKRQLNSAPISLPDATPPPEPSKLTRFDLDFPGGTPAELAAAISTAMGRQLNLVVPTEQAATKIMPMKVDGVTVPELFEAITKASTREIGTIQSWKPDGVSSIQYRNVSMNFAPSGPPVDETTWAFQSTVPTAEELTFLQTARSTAPVCRYFQLAPYLENYSIEDITTAIQTGWRMAKVEPPPQLSFHRETKLLIAVGPQASVDQIPAVLNALQRDRGPAIKKIATLQAELDDVLAKKAGDWEGKARELSERLRQIAAQQKANEAVDNPERIYTGSPKVGPAPQF